VGGDIQPELWYDNTVRGGVLTCWMR
jgi:hypothetical protein